MTGDEDMALRDDDQGWLYHVVYDGQVLDRAMQEHTAFRRCVEIGALDLAPGRRISLVRMHDCKVLATVQRGDLLEKCLCEQSLACPIHGEARD